MPNVDCSQPHDEPIVARSRSLPALLPRRWPGGIGGASLAAASLLLPLAACDDSQTRIFPARPSPGGADGRDTNGAPPRVPADAGGAGVAPDAAASIDRNVFRPEELPATDALIASLSVPSGFSLNVFARELGQARMLATRSGFVYLTRPTPGDVLRLGDLDADGVSDVQAVAAQGLPLVHGIAFRGTEVYLATDTRVLRGSVNLDGDFIDLTPIIDDLPDGGQHPYRTLGIGPDDLLYISVGSSCDACEESNPEHATLLRAALDGTSRVTFARGLRNTIGFGWHPQTEQLWGMDHGSDWRGDDLPPEELNRIEEGNDHGWPYCYGNRQIDLVIDDPPDQSKAERCAQTTPVVLQTQAHNAPIGLVFYAGTSFPGDYAGDAFVAMRGSWNRFPPTGYKVARITFESGVPTGFEDFVTGFLSADGASTFARPAGITVSADGALLVTDDANGYIYRVVSDAAGGPSPAADAGANTGADAGIADGGDAGL